MSDLENLSAASIGSFELFRRFNEEYIFHLIERRVAAHRGNAPIQVMLG